MVQKTYELRYTLSDGTNKACGRFSVEDGKPAYEYARDNGYVGTEAEYAADMNPANLVSKVMAGLTRVETPKIVSSVSEMTDTTKHYVNQETGTIWAYMQHTKITPASTIPNFTNAFDAESAMLNYRWSGSSSAPSSDSPGNVLSDFIPCNLSSGEHILRIKGGYIHNTSNSNTSIVYFSSNANNTQLNMVKYSELTAIEEADGVYSYKLGDKSGSMFSGYQATRYIRVCFRLTKDVTPTVDNIKNVIVTIDEPITYTETPESTEIFYEWSDTGIPYAPSFKTDMIGVMGEGNVIYLSDNLPSGTYTLKYPDNDYATVGTITK